MSNCLSCCFVRFQRNCEAVLNLWTSVELPARRSKYQNYELDDDAVFKLALNNFKLPTQAEQLKLYLDLEIEFVGLHTRLITIPSA
jgi:hypothetical protein